MSMYNFTGWWYTYPIFFILAFYGVHLIFWLIGFLVGGIPTLLKTMKISWDDYSQYLMEK